MTAWGGRLPLPLPSGMVGHGITLFLWQCASKLLMGLGGIWAARALGPEKLGVSAIARNVMTPLTLLVLFGADTLFIRKLSSLEGEEKRHDFISQVFSLRCVFSLAVLAAAAAIALPLCHDQPLTRVMLGSALLLVFISNPPFWVLTSRKMAWQNVRANAIGALCCLVLYAAFRPGIKVGSDLCVQALGTGIAFALGWRAALQNGWLPAFKWHHLRRIAPLLWEARWLMLSSAVIYVYIYLETILVGMFVSVREAGKYQSAVQLANFGSEFLALLPALLYPYFIEWSRQGGRILWEHQLKICWAATPFAVAAGAAVFYIAPWLHGALYGAAYTGAARVFAILFASKLLVLLNGIFAWGLWAQGRDKEAFLKIFLPTAAVSLTGNLLLIPRFGIEAAAVMNALSEVLVLSGAILLARPSSRAL